MIPWAVVALFASILCFVAGMVIDSRDPHGDMTLACYLIGVGCATIAALLVIADAFTK